MKVELTEDMVIEAPWHTANIGLAAALVASGYEINAIGLNGFAFWDDEIGFMDVVNAYMSGKHTVSTHEFYRIVLLLQHLSDKEGMSITPIHRPTNG